MICFLSINFISYITTGSIPQTGQVWWCCSTLYHY